MIRLLGAALLLFGALLAGQALTGLLRRKRAVLRELRGFVEMLQAELLQRGTPLPELFARQADRRGLLWEPVRDCGRTLARGIPADRAMEPLLKVLETGEALPEAAAALGELSRALGKYDAGTQAERCKQVCARLEEQEKRLWTTLTEKGRLSRALSFSAGAVLALMLW